MTHLSVVIPVLNESGLINELIERVVVNAKKITENFEIIMVDDGSKDKTWDEIRENVEKENRVLAIKFSRNFGHHYAISAGIHKSLGEWVVVMDGDLQDRPEVIPDLYKKALQGFDTVFVSRKNRPESIFYKIAQKFFYFVLNSLSGLKFDSTQANFSIINRKVVDAFKKFPENSRFYSSTINWLGFEKGIVIAEHGKRFYGKPSYTFKTRMNLAINILVNFSERPLKFPLYLGSLTLILSIILFIKEIIGHKLSEQEINNMNLIFLTITFNIGLTSIILGVIGLYIGKIYNETKNRPLYVVSEVLEKKI
jgi:glycosyltransferase involved in cell wall biosynthesis